MNSCYGAWNWSLGDVWREIKPRALGSRKKDEGGGDDGGGHGDGDGGGGGGDGDGACRQEEHHESCPLRGRNLRRHHRGRQHHPRGPRRTSSTTSSSRSSINRSNREEDAEMGGGGGDPAATGTKRVAWIGAGGRSLIRKLRFNCWVFLGVALGLLVVQGGLIKVKSFDEVLIGFVTCFPPASPCCTNWDNLRSSLRKPPLFFSLYAFFYFPFLKQFHKTRRQLQGPVRVPLRPLHHHRLQQRHPGHQHHHAQRSQRRERRRWRRWGKQEE